MPESARTFESELAALGLVEVRPQNNDRPNRRMGKALPKAGAAPVGRPPARDLILRLIERLKEEA